ncbi:MAG: virulence RhuM family protein, partial [Betaproteobacteria bacterium]|nr:virulence RhuM family protein [Betaproteobacteria bacterium]
DFAEDQARRRKDVFLKDWTEKLDAFLEFNERSVLDGAGRVSKKQADAHAESEYEQFAAQRRAMLETEGAEVNVRALEDAAKALPKRRKKRK